VREDDCSAYDRQKNYCKNGFPISGTCYGITGGSMPHCLRENWLDDNPRWSAVFMDESGKPKLIASTGDI